MNINNTNLEVILKIAYFLQCSEIPFAAEKNYRRNISMRKVLTSLIVEIITYNFKFKCYYTNITYWLQGL